MAPPVTFCNIPLSTSVDSSSATSRVSLNWILSAGISAPGSVASGILTLPCGDTLSVTSTLPYDVVLGRDWLLFCRETLPHTSFDLSSGSVSPGYRPPPPVDQCGHPDSNSSAMDVDAQPCAATPSQSACADYQVDAVSSPRPDRTACRALSQDFNCAAEMSKAVLNIFLDADHKQMSTENLSHLAAALNISVSGVRMLRFKLRAAIRKHADTISAANARVSTSASIADFFNSFESHRKPILLSIAALHRIQVPDKSTVESLRAAITDHILSGSCTQFSQSHARITLSGDFSLPD
ncbi:hypothetical protein B0H14DRAFT_3141615 [Mycena olivaceomarginata]|nr:hypothetical protein B0H14DRAFT_3141615 [Mycena olivaceomarginata]